MMNNCDWEFIFGLSLVRVLFSFSLSLDVSRSEKRSQIDSIIHRARIWSSENIEWMFGEEPFLIKQTID